MMEAPIRLVQISDTHLFKNNEDTLLGVKTRTSFAAVIELVKQAKKPDLIILSGDISQDDSSESYSYAAQKLAELSVPVYYVPGNHDKISTLETVFSHSMICKDKHILLKNWQIILLNSQKSGAVAGWLDKRELNFLKETLQKYPDHFAIIVLHHHPVASGSVWLDKIGLTNAAELWTIINDFAQVKTILFGHVHQHYEEQKNNIDCLSSPSTCIQFKPKSDNFALEKIPPGYRWLTLHADGTKQTAIKRLSHYIGEFDENAKGY